MEEKWEKLLSKKIQKHLSLLIFISPKFVFYFPALIPFRDQAFPAPLFTITITSPEIGIRQYETTEHLQVPWQWGLFKNVNPLDSCLYYGVSAP